MLVIEDDVQLRALQKALYIAKFESDSGDVSEIAGSPALAEVYRQVVAACIASARANKKMNEVRGWDEWLIAEGRERELAIIRRQVAQTSQWPEMSAEEKLSYVRDLLSPFIARSDTINGLVAAGDAAHECEVAHHD